jgi:hypothetical protein
MEFTYRISEADHLAAARLRRGSMGMGRFRVLMAWVWLIVCVLVLWWADIATNPASRVQTVDDSGVAVYGPPARPTLLSLLRPAPVFLLLWSSVPWLILYYKGTPRLRKEYWKDPAMQGETTVNVTPESISMHHSIGATSQLAWKLFEHWVERDNLILLVLHPQRYVVLCIGGLSDEQRAELHAILSAALPRRMPAKRGLRELIQGES